MTAPPGPQPVVIIGVMPKDVIGVIVTTFSSVKETTFSPAHGSATWPRWTGCSGSARRNGRGRFLPPCMSWPAGALRMRRPNGERLRC